jgi:tetratricopeptide (TPR) repeat protein
VFFARLEFFFKIPIKIRLCLLFGIAIVIVYGQTLGFQFINFDDDLYVTENRFVQAGLTGDNFIWSFNFRDKKKNYWHPLTWISHMLDVDLYGMDPGRHHLTNVLFHLANTLLLFFLLHRMTGTLWRSAAVAILFALHPINAESVAWVAERKNVLSTFFWMLTLLAYIYYTERPHLRRYLVVFCVFCIGLLAKPMLVTLPFVLLLLDYWPLKRIVLGQPAGDNQLPAMGVMMEKIPLLGLSLLSIYVSSASVQGMGNVMTLHSRPLTLRISHATVSYLKYIAKMIWPQNLAVFYPFPDKIPLWQFTAALTVLMVVTLAVFRERKRRPYLGIGWLWYLGTLMPVIGLVQVGLWPAMADRWAYIPSIGIFLMLAWGVPDLWKRRRFSQPALAATLTVVISAGMVLTWIQVAYWKDSFTLFQHALKVTSKNYIADNILGIELKNQGKVDQAVTHFKTAVKIKPSYALPYYNLANSLELQGETAQAIKNYEQAIRLSPDLASAHNNLGVLLEKQGQLNEAVAHFKAVLELNAEDAGIHLNIGNVLVKQKKYDAALEHYHAALGMDPENADIYYNLGIAFNRQGKTEEAIRQFSVALKNNPDFAEAHYNLANVLVKKGRLDEAIEHYRKALAQKPDYIEVLNNLAFVLAVQKKYENAVDVLKKWVTLEPDNPKIDYNVAGLYARQNEISTAIKWLATAFQKGYRNCSLIQTDPDLENIRDEPGYSDLLKRYCY